MLQKKRKVKAEITNLIDVNDILTVTAIEQTIQDKIKNEQKKENKKIDTNLKETLKKFQNALNEAEDDEERYNNLMNYNNISEKSIDNLLTDFDNETMAEKYYIYEKDLIISYSRY